MENTATLREQEKKWKKVINRIDILLIIATILYYVRVVNILGDDLFSGAGFNYFIFIQALAENTGLLGILLLSVSLFTFSAIIYFAVKEQMVGEIGEGKVVTMIIWNGIWIIGDSMLLHMALFGAFYYS